MQSLADDAGAEPDDLGAPGAEAAGDAERRRAVDLAYRALSVRERTEAELRAFLERRRVEPAAIEDAVAELAEVGYVDDARYARMFADDKRRIERWGAERIERDLRRRGVATDLIDAALADGRDGELEAAVELLSERFGPLADDRARDRAWKLLVRRGYAPELAYEAVRTHERAHPDAA